MSTLKLRDSLTRALHRTVKTANKSITSVDQAQTILETMQKYFDQLTAAQFAVDAVSGDEEIKFQEVAMENSEKLFFEAKERLLGYIRRHSLVQATTPVSDAHTSTVPSLRLRMPKWNIPKFNGDAQQWNSFSDLFTKGIVSDASLSKAQKLQYLFGFVEGPAEQLIRPFEITDANFEKAWELLGKRFGNMGIIVEAHFKTLFDQPVLSNENGIRKLLDSTNNSIMSLQVLKLPTEHWDDVLVYWVVSRLPAITRREWRLVKTENELASFKELEDFLETRCRSIELDPVVTPRRDDNIPAARYTSNNKTGGYQRPYRTSMAATTYSKDECNYCKDKEHQLRNCPGFLALKYEARVDHVRLNNLCFNCLKGNHSAAYCKSSYCRVCQYRHNTLLHQWISRTTEPAQASQLSQPSQISQTPQPSQPTQPSQPSTSSSNLVMSRAEPDQVLLATAVVNVQAFDGSHLMVRALLDTGSQVTFITDNCVQRLKLPRVHNNMDIAGVGGNDATRTNGMVKVKVTSCTRDRFSTHMNCYVLKKITSYAPARMTRAQAWPTFESLELADPDYQQYGSIDILMGADVLGSILLEGVIPSNDRGVPAAQDTKFGWVLLGPTRSPCHSMTISTIPSHHDDLQNIIRKFWEMEELEEIEYVNEEDETCERIFAETHTRTESGRYVVNLPLKTNVNELGDSRFGAIRRLLSVEKRLSADEELKQQYVAFMDEYVKLGHMELAPSINGSSYYLPHHSVIKLESSTTKLRVVFDASFPSTTGVSLNQTLLVGPKIQKDLVQIVMNFRKHKVALTSDIAKMYRQVLVADKHQDLQRIVWRRTPLEPIQDYRMKTVTYGTASAAYLAVRCLNQLATDEADKYAAASSVMKSDFYVDDLMTGAHNVEEALQLQNDLIALGNLGGFDLRKWMSNEPSLVESVTPSQRENADILRLFSDETTSVKTLGICWFPAIDCFGFRVKSKIVQNPTKRSVLSTIAKLFDPLGWLAPCVVKAKILMQELWSIQLDWDETLPLEMMCKWREFERELTKLEEVVVNRWLTTDQTTQLEVHGFADASEVAYGAAVYVRVIHADRQIHTRLINSKSKVAPIKTLSIPRLELCAAELLSRLLSYVHSSLRVNDATYYAWTDSAVVLGWLNKTPSTWSVFVANRVSKIQRSSVNVIWRHVRSADNPADCLSRGVAPSEIKDKKIWWTGPEWLGKGEAEWPSTTSTNQFVTTMELKKTAVVSAISSKLNDVSELLNRYSSLRRLKLITTRVFRCVKRWKHEKITSDVITVEELSSALEYWIKYVQGVEFERELKDLANKTTISTRSKYVSLNPFMDTNGVLRVGGRLQKATLTYNQTHQIILPPKHTLTNLILLDIHEKCMHGGIQQMLQQLRSTYWIVGARSVIRSFIHRCMVCFRQKRNTCEQLMGNLPVQRVTQSRPFSNCGVDFAGPIAVRASKIRGRGTITTKGYISVFVCFATKAIHLEAVSDLTTDAFLAAYTRFTARRGPCLEMFSDNGLNFVGAKRQLDEMEKDMLALIKPELRQILSIRGTNWNFIPPGSPHFGGLWEAGVKSMKFHLRRVIGDTILTYEELSTVLAEIEVCLNSRPLCGMSDDVEDLAALTPSHFLIGEPTNTVSAPDMTAVPVNRLKRWQLLQSQQQDFWKRWRTEYLARLQQRPKWATASPNVQPGQLVVIKDENVPSSRWALGRILETFPGDDGMVRVVSLKCKSGTLKRPISKICPLPIDC